VVRSIESSHLSIGIKAKERNQMQAGVFGKAILLILTIGWLALRVVAYISAMHTREGK
jgi:hypothetical protein